MALHKFLLADPSPLNATHQGKYESHDESHEHVNGIRCRQVQVQIQCQARRQLERRAHRYFSTGAEEKTRSRDTPDIQGAMKRGVVS